MRRYRSRHSTPNQTSEETVSGLFRRIKLNRNFRCALLAGTMMLPAIAVPTARAADGSAASSSQYASQDSSQDGTIILAQAPAVDPQTGKPLPKGVPPKGNNQPPPKGAQGGQPQGAQQQQQQQQQKLGVQPKSNQPAQGNAQPGGQPPANAGALPPQQKLGVQPKTFQPAQGNAQPGGQPPANAGALPQGAPPQQKLGVQNPNQPVQGGATHPGGQPPTQQKLGAQPPSNQPPAAAGTPTQQKFGAQPPTNQPLQDKANVVPGAQPLPSPGAGPSPAAQPAQAGLPAKGGVSPPATAAAVATGTVDQVRGQRQERHEAGGRIVIEEPGNRLIVRENGVAFVRHDETERFRVWGEPRLERRGAEQFAVVARPGGYEIITVTDPATGRLLRRVRRGPDGREVILIENRIGPGVVVGVGAGLAAGVILGLTAPVITIPRERYIVDVTVAPAPLLYETLEAPPLVEIERPYSLDEIRYNVALRDRMRRIDIDSVTFDTGSWEVMPEQQPKLQVVADALQHILSRHPDEMFLIEGHTDAVGNDVDNLSLSDRRAESVAVILSNMYQIPPENVVTQGYGSQYMKIPTDGPSRENRRVTVRRITPLLQGKMARL
jgi:outer membrane protein OmpA-like peptidoglycan-associated protein